MTQKQHNYNFIIRIIKVYGTPSCMSRVLNDRCAS